MLSAVLVLFLSPSIALLSLGAAGLPGICKFLHQAWAFDRREQAPGKIWRISQESRLLWQVSWWHCQACIPPWVASLSSSFCFWHAGGKTVSNPSFAVHNVGGSCMHKQRLEAFINLSPANGFLFLVLTCKCELCQAQNTVFALESLSDSPSLTWGALGLNLSGIFEIISFTTFLNSVQLPGRGVVYYGKSAGMYLEVQRLI